MLTANSPKLTAGYLESDLQDDAEVDMSDLYMDGMEDYYMVEEML